MADRLYDLAKVMRSKNSGPFEITLDILFDSPAAYERVKASGAINPQNVSERCGINLESIRRIVFFDAALGIKITYLRAVSSGTAGDRDVYGAQQHPPMMDILID